MLTTDKRSPWLFASKRYDPETEFYFFGRRYYSPTLGRWITPDPQGFDDGPNLYAYLHNCPLNAFDLYGLWGMPTWRIALGKTAQFTFPITYEAFHSRHLLLWQQGILVGGAAFEIISTFVPPARAGRGLDREAKQRSLLFTVKLPVFQRKFALFNKAIS